MQTAQDIRRNIRFVHLAPPTTIELWLIRAQAQIDMKSKTTKGN
jgi:hypothetical protein